MSILHYLIDGPRVAVFPYVLAHVPFPVLVKEASVVGEASAVDQAFVQRGDTLVVENDVPVEVQSVQ